MSVTLMSQVWKIESLPASDKLVLLCLADNANDDGKCWPSISNIAARCSLTRRGVMKIIARLEEYKFISKSGRHENQSTIYKITPACGEYGSPPSEPRSPVNTVHQGTTFTSSGEYGSPQVVNTVHPNHNITITKPSGVGSRLALTHPPSEWIEFCKRERPDLNPEKLFEVFRDHWISIPGSKGRKLDWFATWRNWVRNQFSKKTDPPGRHKPYAVERKPSNVTTL